MLNFYIAVLQHNTNFIRFKKKKIKKKNKIVVINKKKVYICAQLILSHSL